MLVFTFLSHQIPWAPVWIALTACNWMWNMTNATKQCKTVTCFPDEEETMTHSCTGMHSFMCLCFFNGKHVLWTGIWRFDGFCSSEWTPSSIHSCPHTKPVQQSCSESRQRRFMMTDVMNWAMLDNKPWHSIVCGINDELVSPWCATRTWCCNFKTPTLDLFLQVDLGLWLQNMASSHIHKWQLQWLGSRWTILCAVALKVVSEFKLFSKQVCTFISTSLVHLFIGECWNSPDAFLWRMHCGNNSIKIPWLTRVRIIICPAIGRQGIWFVLCKEVHFKMIHHEFVVSSSFAWKGMRR